MCTVHCAAPSRLPSFALPLRLCGSPSQHASHLVATFHIPCCMGHPHSSRCSVRNPLHEFTVQPTALLCRIHLMLLHSASQPFSLSLHFSARILALTTPPSAGRHQTLTAPPLTVRCVTTPRVHAHSNDHPRPSLKHSLILSHYSAQLISLHCSLFFTNLVESISVHPHAHYAITKCCSLWKRAGLYCHRYGN